MSKDEDFHKDSGLLTTEVHFNRDICGMCKNYQERNVYGSMHQVIDNICNECYGSKLYIVKYFEPREGMEDARC